MKEFIMGLAIGMAGGAVLVANSCKLRQMIKKNQDELMKKAETYIDEQLEKGTSNGTAESGGAKKTKKNEKNRAGAAAYAAAPYLGTHPSFLVIDAIAQILANNRY